MLQSQNMELVIEPGNRYRWIWKDVWLYREVLAMLIWRDIKVRYKQTVMGIAWAVIRPLLTTLIFTYVFHSLAGMRESSGIPYALLVLTGTLAWQFFSSAFQEASTSMLNNSALVSKVYFPRVLIPLSALGGPLVDFCITLVIVVLYALYSQAISGIQLIFLPVFLLLTVLTVLGLGLFFSALTVRYRDLRFVVPFVIQFGLFVSPVGFSSEAYHQPYTILFYLNPLTGIIDGFRWAIIGTPLQPGYLLLSVLSTLILLAVGIFVFNRQEHKFTDQL
jgi:lipopolysaccharide transport system permease protein